MKDGPGPIRITSSRKKGFRGVTKGLHESRRCRYRMTKSRSGNGDQGDEVVKVRLQARDRLGNLQEVRFIDAGNDHCAHLDDAAPGLRMEAG
jgi:hypothetical protein